MRFMLARKANKASFSSPTSYCATRILELIYGDLCGPISPPTVSHNRYIFVLIEDHLHYMWLILLKEKSEAFNKFKKFKVLVE